MRANVDFNLLVALTALLEERHVTRAARRVPMSQPAMSDCLSRLRRHYDDELLTRVGNHFELTLLGRSLRDSAAAALEMVNRTFAARSGFDPARTDREFVVYASDYAVTLIGGVLARMLGESAPHARLRFPPVPAADADQGDALLGRGDGVIGPWGTVAGVPGMELFRDEWVCVAAETNERVGAELTLETMAAMPWVDVVEQGTSSPALGHLRARGLEPAVDIVVGSFHPVPFLVAGSERIAVMARRLADHYRGVAAIRVMPLPYDSGPLVATLWWHPAHGPDPGHSWLRALLRKAGREIT